MQTSITQKWVLNVCHPDEYHSTLRTALSLCNAVIVGVDDPTIPPPSHLMVTRFPRLQPSGVRIGRAHCVLVRRHIVCLCGGHVESASWKACALSSASWMAGFVASCCCSISDSDWSDLVICTAMVGFVVLWLSRDSIYSLGFCYTRHVLLLCLIFLEIHIGCGRRLCFVSLIIAESKIRRARLLLLALSLYVFCRSLSLSLSCLALPSPRSPFLHPNTLSKCAPCIFLVHPSAALSTVRPEGTDSSPVDRRVSGRCGCHR